MTAGLSAHYADVITSKLGVSPYAAIPEAYRPSTGANITCSENLLRNLAELTALVPDLASFQNRITKAMERRGHNRTVGGTKYYLSASDVIVAVLETQEAMDRSLRGQPGRRGLAINFGKAQEQERQAYLTKPVTATKITRESESSGSPLNGLGDEIDVAVKRRQEDAMGNPLVAHSLEPASSSWTPNSVSEPVRSQRRSTRVRRVPRPFDGANEEYENSETPSLPRKRKKTSRPRRSREKKSSAEKRAVSWHHEHWEFFSPPKNQHFKNPEPTIIRDVARIGEIDNLQYPVEVVSLRCYTLI